MLTNIIYFAVFIILVFVLSIAVKAITRGVEAKQTIKDEKNLELDKEEAEKQNVEIVTQIKELKNLHDKGIISDQEFQKAKEKILN
ncbi:SHOCT domain-containing protein [Pelagibacterales bacterium SAG-MED17]|nr:SHOCT domain-containing protein [Pelagibacterales bacterium SAG-MED17]